MLKLAYGHEQISLELPAGIPCRLLEIGHREPLPDPGKALLKALRSPISSAPLRETVRAGETICLLVNDSTRLARSEFFLPYIVSELTEAGIKEKDIFIVFTNGSHRPMSKDEMENLAGENVSSRIQMFNHDSRDNDELVFLGDTSFDTPVYVNKKVKEADRRILTGSVVHHFFAGFGGGRKALIPGVAGWETIRKNHSLLLDERAVSGKLDGNPVHEDLLEAALMVGGDFLLNTVLDQDKNILGFYAGDMVEGHRAACAMADRVYGIEIDRPADVVIASCGGYPKDINVYQAHKTLDNAVKALKKGGRLILVARCPEGIGSEAYEQWAEKYRSLSELEAALRSNFYLGGHKAYTVARLLRQGTVYLVSDLDPGQARLLGFVPVSSLEEAVSEVYKNSKDLFTCVIPQGSLVVPRMKGVAS